MIDYYYTPGCKVNNKLIYNNYNLREILVEFVDVIHVLTHLYTHNICRT